MFFKNEKKWLPYFVSIKLGFKIDNNWFTNCDEKRVFTQYVKYLEIKEKSCLDKDKWSE